MSTSRFRLHSALSTRVSLTTVVTCILLKFCTFLVSFPQFVVVEAFTFYRALSSTVPPSFLSTPLSSSDCRVIIAFTTVVIFTAQIVVGSFDADGKKEPKQPKLAPLPSDTSLAPLKLAPTTTGLAAGPSSPPSRATLSLSESSGGAPSPPHVGASGGGGHGQQQPGGFSGLSWK